MPDWSSVLSLSTRSTQWVPVGGLDPGGSVGVTVVSSGALKASVLNPDIGISANLLRQNTWPNTADLTAIRRRAEYHAAPLAEPPPAQPQVPGANVCRKRRTEYRCRPVWASGWPPRPARPQPAMPWSGPLGQLPAAHPRGQSCIPSAPPPRP